MALFVANLQKISPYLWKLIRKSTFQAVILAIVYIAVVLFVSIHLIHDSYGSTALDLGLFAQTLKYTLGGNLLYNTIEGLSHLAYHFSPILLLLAPIYWIAPYCETLLIVQATALGISGYLVYLLARNYKLNHRTSLFIEGLFFINPLVWGVALFDFHPVALAVPTLLVMFIGLIQKRWKLFTIGFVLSLMTKEDVVIALAIFGLVMLIADYIKNKKVDKIYLTILVASIATYGIGVFASMVASDGDYPHILTYTNVRYEYLSQPIVPAILGAIRTFFSAESLFLALAYLVPLAFLPLFSLRWAAPGLFILIVNMLSTYLAQHYELRQYAAAAIPFLFIALISTLTHTREKSNLQSRLTKLVPRLPIYLVIVMVTSALLVNFHHTSRIRIATLPSKHEEAINRVISQIPDGITVTANNNIFTHLCSRTDTYLPQFIHRYTPIDSGDWGFPNRETEYIVIDRVYKQHYIGGYWEDVVINELNKKYQLVVEIDGAKLYKLRHDD
jgi:uncharacterized membrane protein